MGIFFFTVAKIPVGRGHARPGFNDAENIGGCWIGCEAKNAGQYIQVMPDSFGASGASFIHGDVPFFVWQQTCPNEAPFLKMTKW